jgi:predicted nucleotidyltransferase
VAVLRAVTAQATPVSERELARRTRLTPRSVRMALDDLVALGVVHRREGGREHAIALNRAHELAASLEAAFAADAAFFLSLRRHLGDIARELASRGLLQVALFGSVARAEERPDSDLDLLLIGRTTKAAEQARDHYLDLAPALQAHFGVRVNPVAYTLASVRRGVASGRPPFPELLQDSVVIHGPALQDLLAR